MLTRSPVHAIALLRELSARFAELQAQQFSADRS
jgi:hypothetical protein